MQTSDMLDQLNRTADIVRLDPQIVGRFYRDGNRLGQRSANARKPAWYKPERWIASSTRAVNPVGIPSGGLSVCSDIRDAKGGMALANLLADTVAGPRLLGEKRYQQHGGRFRVLIKLLDAADPIPFHVHADDAYVSTHPTVYAQEQFGKDEAYHYLDVPKGACPYLHLGLRPGVNARDLVAAVQRGTDHVLELSQSDYQMVGEGFIVKAGLMHRPGTALTLEIQQPSDVYTLFQLESGGVPLLPDTLHPGFKSLEEAAEQVINWRENHQPDLIEKSRLRPHTVSMANLIGGKVEWVFPPEASAKFSGMRLTVETTMNWRVSQPHVLYVWQGQGTVDGHAIAGHRGVPGESDEFFIGLAAAERGVSIANTGDEPLVVFALFAASV